MGRIYTVIRSKVPTIIPKCGDNYCLAGPYVEANVSVEFEKEEPLPKDAIGRSVQHMRDMGYMAHYGRWPVSGRPKAVLF